ncbi:MAG: carbon starvation protein A [Verrucomicrobia bacterium]|nr:carbon starvation protein A [Verrucomicrobiota bacterium]MCF7708129.1 carbon starvation protein A [Verrucomicrobiota bacterium]
METLFIALFSALGFIVAYHTYGRWLGRRIFGLSKTAECPSRKFYDGTDYVPTGKSVIFGHHFTSIAGTGPIVGPAIAILWGWLPALLWVLIGSVFIGAVHDMSSLVVSLRNRGQTVGDIAGRVINRRVRLLFLFVLFFVLTIVLAIFGLVIATVFKLYPSSIFPCMVQIPLAIGIGLWLHRKGVGLFVPSLIALAVMYATVLYGNSGFLGDINSYMAGEWPLWNWVVGLLIYCYIASVLPVWVLLQPRDYINSLQLLSAIVLIVCGLGVAAVLGGVSLPDGSHAALELSAPMVQLNPVGAPILFPFLFITVACGAISGFHCLVSSGTSSKQVRCEEPDARFVGYGSMLMEAFLAILVILACSAGLGLGIETESGAFLTGHDAWISRYSSWSAAGSLGDKLGAFVDGAANFLKALGLSLGAGKALMGVLVASFAATTMDTACRIQRYVIQELSTTFLKKRDSDGGIQKDTGGCACISTVSKWLQNKHGATIFAVVVAAMLAAVPPPGQAWTFSAAGKGGMILWPLFGATNQLLAGLSFLVVIFYLYRRNKPIWFIVLPMLFMLIMPLWAMILQLFFGAGDDVSWLYGEKWVLVFIGTATIALEIWMVIEGLIMFPKAKGVIEEAINGEPEQLNVDMKI